MGEALSGGPPAGRLVENLMHFARVLRAAGMPVGPGRVIEAVRAVEAAGIRRRDDFYWTLHAVFVNRRDQRELFDQAFHVFWRNPKLLERSLALLLPGMTVDAPEEDPSPIARRLAEAFLPQLADTEAETEGQEETVVDATLTWSDAEQLQTRDFDAMSARELADAKTALTRFRLALKPRRTRRFEVANRGARIDMRRSLKASLRSGGALMPLVRKRRRIEPPPLVALCDISGSMDRYSRMALHFLHALTNDRHRVHTFLFGTRLSNVTRQMRQRDVDIALAKIGKEVDDWAGGTRIGVTVDNFNRLWSRRVLGQGAVVLLISDGLDRDGGAGLEAAMDRLHRSCARLIWLNPLLRWDGFEPKSQGIRAILPHVDEFRPVHNLASLADLARALSRPAPPRGQIAKAWGL